MSGLPKFDFVTAAGVVAALGGVLVGLFAANWIGEGGWQTRLVLVIFFAWWGYRLGRSVVTRLR